MPETASGSADVPTAVARTLPWRAIAAVLLALVMASSLAVIFATHQTREQFRALQQSRREENRIQIEWRQLLLERSTLSSHARVEGIARSALQLKPVDGEIHRVVIE